MFYLPMYLGLVFFTDISCHTTDNSPHSLRLPFRLLFLHFLDNQVSRYGNWTVSADLHEAENVRLNEVQRSVLKCGSSVRSLLHVTLLARKIWKRHSVFLKTARSWIRSKRLSRLSEGYFSLK